MEALGDEVRKPMHREVWDRPEDCKKRLDSYGFAKGCLFVTIRATNTFAPGSVPSYTWKCCFHSVKTANKRGLEHKTERDEQGKLTTVRQRDTAHSRRGCQVAYTVSFAQVKQRQPKRHWVGKWLYNKDTGLPFTHSDHPLPKDPFDWQEHRANAVEWQALTSIARRYRSTNQPFSAALRMIDAELLGFTMTSKEYYNLIRRAVKPKEQPSLIAFMKELKEEGFEVRFQSDDVLVDNKVVSKQITCIFFWSLNGVELAQRFCSGHLLLLDATFNTNKNRMPILVAVGVTNTDETFLVVFAYIPGEQEQVFTFFFECLRSEIFTTIQPAVVLSDQAAGIIAANTRDALNGSFLQLCQWHIVEGMIRHYRKEGHYTADEIQRPYKEGEDLSDPQVATLQTLTWRYAQSSSIEELDINRAILINRLHPVDRSYIIKTIEPKEPQFVNGYCQLRPNLGHVATSRSEGWHRIVHSVTNGLLTLTESAKHLAVKTNSTYSRIKAVEKKLAGKDLVSLPLDGFNKLKGQVSHHALRRIEREWMIAQNYWHRLRQLSSERSIECDCEVIKRFSLPCYHLLERCIEDNQQIPMNLIHPRWHLNGPPIVTEWHPRQEDHVLVISPRRVTSYTTLNSLDHRRRGLSRQDQATFDKAVKRSFAAIEQTLGGLEEDTALPLLMPKVILKRQRPAVSKKRDARELTANEAAIKEVGHARHQLQQLAKDAEVLQRRQEEQQLAEPVAEQVDDHLVRPVSPTPPMNAPPTERSLSPVHDTLPPSTAPPRIGETTIQTGRPTRAKKRTAKKQEAVAAGLMKDSQCE